MLSTPGIEQCTGHYVCPQGVCGLIDTWEIGQAVTMLCHTFLEMKVETECYGRTWGYPIVIGSQ